MKSTRTKAVVLGIPVAALLLAFIFFATPSQPSYHGIRLRQWLEVLHPLSGRSAAEVREAQEAIRHIGQAGLPWLLEWLKAEDGRLAKAFAQRYYATLAPFGITRFWKPAVDHNAKAEWAFRVLGEVADPAIPQLVAMVTNAPNTERAMRGLRALCGIGSERAFEAVLSLESTRPMFTKEFLRGAFQPSNPEMVEFVERRLREGRRQH